MTSKRFKKLLEKTSETSSESIEKLLPELKDLIDAVEQGGVGDAMPEDQELMMSDDNDMPKDMGALGKM